MKFRIFSLFIALSLLISSTSYCLTEKETQVVFLMAVLQKLMNTPAQERDEQYWNNLEKVAGKLKECLDTNTITDEEKKKSVKRIVGTITSYMAARKAHQQISAAPQSDTEAHVS